MPEPGENEKEDDFIDRCIPVVIKDGTAKDGSQANAICHSIWEESKKKKTSSKGELRMKWYEIKAQAENSEIWLYDEIGLYGIGAKEFIAELNAVKSSKIDLHLNSPGGEVFEGSAIYNALKRHPAKVTTYIDGIAASIASVIALAGDKVIMAENAIYMLHNPSGLVMGTSEDMRKTADILDKVRDSMVGAYATKSRHTESEIKAMMDAETWFDAKEAKEAGFIDEIGDEMDLAACIKFVPIMSRMGFRHIPNNLTAKKTPSEKELERALRDVGCSVKQAKTILARGYSDGLRDVDTPPEPPKATEPLRDVEQPKQAEKVEEAKVISEDKHKTIAILNDQRFLSV